MKKLCAMLIMLVSLCLWIIPSQAVHAPVSVGIVNYSLKYNGTLINSELNHPLISYENTTYMAVRDVASLWNRNVFWDAENQTINIEGTHSDADGYTTALTMGKAIINKYYNYRITENTKYFLGFSYSCAEHPQYWILCATFDNDEISDDDIIEYADVYVMMDSESFDYFLAERIPNFKVVIDLGPLK